MINVVYLKGLRAWVLFYGTKMVFQSSSLEYITVMAKVLT